MQANKEQHKQPADKAQPAALDTVAAQQAEAERTQNNTNGIQMPNAPKIELPKGGGAIRGMGEKFQANPVTGTGSFSIPIAMTEGRGGLTPALGLSYNSGSGNSPYGMGWNIGLPSISRKTQQELPQYKDSEESDTFLLSGAEDLIPALRNIGTNNTDNWIRDEFVDTSGTIHYNVYRYRPRIEGLFARIERWVNTSDGTAHWRSITRENVTTWYGQTAQSRIVDPADPTRIFQWLIDETRDDKGNVIQYIYQQEDATGVNNSLPEKNRLATGNYTQRYLKHVYYGNTVMHTHANFDTTNQWLFQLAFDYGDLENDSPTTATNPAWTARSDAFSTYRAGFEVRTHRICQRILMFHNFTELGGNTLVKATEFEYDNDPTGYRLASVQHHGYKEGTKDSLPPMRFSYTKATLDDTLRHFDVDDLENLPMGVDGQQYQWADLYGEGITGVVTEGPDAWYYKRNEGNEAYYQDHPASSPPPPDIRFGAQHTVAAKPNMGGIQQLGDFNGDGQLELLIRSENLNGYFTLASPAGSETHIVSDFDSAQPSANWSRFKHLENVPVLNWQDPNLRLLDLNGDGVPDVLLSNEHCFRYWPSERDTGYGERLDIITHTDEEQGPKLVFADTEQVIHLADMSGDGLTDIVRVRNNEVCYWPNLGYGRFGQKITMDGAPTLDYPDQFSKVRIRLADMDGSGTTDLIYLGTDTVQYWHNQSGNRFSLAKEIKHFPRVDNLAAVNVMDLFGKGTACLVWSSPLPGDEPYRIRYIDLFGQKPYLLSEVDNNVGGLHRYHYAPSTKFYLRDRQEGKPWITKLPFPVHVVERTEQYDQVTGARFVTRYAYHHGYFDHHEREFRGFGMVEQWDTEQYENFQQDDLFQVGSNALDEDSHIAPIKTKSWFHLGFWEDSSTITQQYANEYYQGDAQAMQLPDSTLSGSKGYTAEETRQAMRALKGQLLRSEVYAEDGTAESAHPYTVATANFKVKRIQPGYQTVQPDGRWNHQLASFQVIPQESLNVQYERNSADPRVSHSLVLKTDDYGLVTRAAAIAYPRRGSGHYTEQTTGLITVTESDFKHKDSILEVNRYRLGIPTASRSYELTGLSISATALLNKKAINDAFTASLVPAHSLDYLETSTSGVKNRLIGEQRAAYWQDDLSGIADTSTSGTDDVYRALPYHTQQLALTSAMLASVYNDVTPDRVTETDLLNNANYTKQDGNYWVQSDRITVDAAQFYLPTQVNHLSGGTTTVAYDTYNLAAIQITDAVNQSTASLIDYRTLSPWQVTDINDNRQQVAFDALGMVTAVAVMGKVGDTDGDTLVNPTQRITYSLTEWSDPNKRKPNWTKTEVRKNHVGEVLRWLTSYEYTGGLGQVIQQKTSRRPGHAMYTDADGNLVLGTNNQPKKKYVPVRWLGSGLTVFNNKGKVVRQYEPYFINSHEYDSDERIRTFGVSPTIHYDPLGRVIRTDMPDNSYSKVVFTPWEQKNYDQNDTALETKWVSDNIDPNQLPTTEPTHYLMRAAWLTVKHYDTPQILHSDVLGRVFLTQDDEGHYDQQTGVTTHNYCNVHATLDIEGKRKAVTNALNQVTTFTYSMLPLDQEGNGDMIATDSPDGGWRKMLSNQDGLPYKAWNERGFTFRNQYDLLDRPTHSWVNEGSGEVLVSYMLYGDHNFVTNPKANNLLGQAVHSYDQSGVTHLTSVDFKGNVLTASTQLAKNYKDSINWSGVAAALDVTALHTATNALVETEVFTTTTAYNALNLPTDVVLPDNSRQQFGYDNQAGLLNIVSVKMPHEAAFTQVVEAINYDEKERLYSVKKGNGTTTVYRYETNTSRLSLLRTHRNVYNSNGDLLRQDFLQYNRYTYDAVGNIVEIRDESVQDAFFSNTVVSAGNTYEYNALYRLIKGNGREKNALTRPTHEDLIPFLTGPDGKSAETLAQYTETYSYDKLGNMTSLAHTNRQNSNASWTQNYQYTAVTSNNYLQSTYVGNSAPTLPDYTYDAHGNMLTMPHLNALEWDFADQLKSTEKNHEKTYYVYAGGQRIRKVCVNTNTNKIKHERIYLGGVEIYRQYDTAETLQNERYTQHASDGAGNACLIEVRTKKDGNDTTITNYRYQYGNHLNSAALELNHKAEIISYEEYHPFGTTSYQLHDNQTDVSSKRYRYCGKERDEESGLYYYGARYYAAWLCRFISVDPLKDKYPYYTTYQYAGNKPITFIDLDGLEEASPEKLRKAAKAGVKKANDIANKHYGGNQKQALCNFGCQGAVKSYTGKDLFKNLRANKIGSKLANNEIEGFEEYSFTSYQDLQDQANKGFMIIGATTGHVVMLVPGEMSIGNNWKSGGKMPQAMDTGYKGNFESVPITEVTGKTKTKAYKWYMYKGGSLPVQVKTNIEEQNVANANKNNDNENSASTWDLVTAYGAELIDSLKNWYNNTSEYINTLFLDDEIEDTEQKPKSDSKSVTIINAPKGLNIRSAGSSSASVKGSLQNDDIVQLTGNTSEAWIEVLYGNNKTGWIHSDYTNIIQK